MRLSFNMLQALAALTLWLDTQTLAVSHQSIHHARRRDLDIGPSRAGIFQRRSSSEISQIPLAQLQQLQGYTTTYHLWMNLWFSQQPPSSPLLTEIHQHYQEYDDWVNTWMAKAVVATSAVANTSVATAPSSPAVDSLPPPKPESSSAQAATTAASQGAPLSPPSLSSSLQKLHNNASISSDFNPNATNNIATYWGSGALGTKIGLNKICMDPDVNIVVLAFLTAFKSNTSSYPTIDFSDGCGGQTQEQKVKGAAGLLHCDQMAAAIRNCQSRSKKVLLSIGGEMGVATIDLASDAEAISTAGMLWDLFGGGIASVGLRPFGSLKLDGFDVDDENKKPDHWTVLVQTLRNKFAEDPSKHYYISAAPQCPAPDASIPLAAMQEMDFVWVQFYNNPQCNLNTTAFAKSFEGWSENLSANGKGPRLFIGAPGCVDTTVNATGGCAGSGYIEPDKLPGIVNQVKGKKNMGGMMLWDASRAYMNNHYAKAAKAALKG